MSPLPKEIQRVLNRLRWAIRRYVFLEGIALLVTLASLMFWITFGVDVAYFKLSRLELPTTFRLFALVVMVAVLAGIAGVWIFLRLLHSLRRKDLALVLERRFPQLNDQLITTIELDQPATSELQSAMLEQTRREAAAKVAALDLTSTFDLKPLRQMAVVATVLICTLAVFSVANAAGVQRWVNAFLLGRNGYWEPYRQQSLLLKVIAQPGERIKEFDKDRTYKHPRGSDLNLLVVNNESGISPQAVDVQYMSFSATGSQRGRATMSRTGEDRFEQVISQVVDDHHLWIRGGDFTNRYPYRIQVVDPPEVNELSLKCDYPSYTGMDGQEDQLVRVVGTQVSLPMETAFILQARCNKPIRFVDVRSDRFQLSVERNNETQQSTTSLTLFDDKQDVIKVLDVIDSAAPVFTDDRTAFEIPLQVTTKAEETWSTLDGTTDSALAILPDSTLKITLADDDDIYSPEPAALLITGIVDRPPVIDTKRTGVGTLVTRNASLPIQGSLTDDYGLADAWFGYRLGSETGDNQLPLAHAPTGQTTFALGSETKEAVERFNLRPLKLQEGQILTLGVYAKDGDDLNGPHIAHGELFNFKIVSDDELESRLIDRELNLRLRFEQIREEVGDLREELTKHLQSAEEFDNTPAEDSPPASVLSSFVERSLHQLRKNHTESRAIEISFLELREEMVNNNVHNREKLDRIDNGVISPLNVLNDKLFDEADKRYALQRLKLQRQSGVQEAVRQTIPAVDEVLAQMDRILESMRTRGSINDLIQNLQDAIERQRKLLEETENKRIEENFFFDLNP